MRIDEQDALDAIDAYEQNAANCFEEIERLEASHAQLEEDFHAWVGDALHFRRDPDFYRSEHTILYGPDSDRWGAMGSAAHPGPHRLAGTQAQQAYANTRSV